MTWLQPINLLKNHLNPSISSQVASVPLTTSNRGLRIRQSGFNGFRQFTLRAARNFHQHWSLASYQTLKQLGHH